MVRSLLLIISGIFSVLRGFLAFIGFLIQFIARPAFFVFKILAFLAAAVTLLGGFAYWIRRKIPVSTSKSTLKVVNILCVAGFLFVSSPALCEEKPPEPTPDLIHRTDPPPNIIFRDRSPRREFGKAMNRQLARWKKWNVKKLNKTVATFPQRPVTTQDLRESLAVLNRLLSETDNPRLLHHAIAENFDLFQMSGKTGKGDVLLTAYYHPIIPGSRTRSEKYPYPLYRKPKDMLKIDLSEFNESLPKKRLVGRIKNRSVVPYFDHEEIVEEQTLRNRGLELAFVASPLDRFFLQIQGSGSLLLPNGKTMPVNYEGSNGHPYVGIGRELVRDDLLSRGELSMQAIRDLLDHDDDLRKEYVYRNPSFVFFQSGKGGPRGAGGAVLTPKRSVAMDKKIFPMGAPVWIQFRKPSFSAGGEIDSWHSSSGFFINQDTGGAIKGAGRVDLYLGAGRRAEETAGRLAHYGQVYFLILKKKPV